MRHYRCTRLTSLIAVLFAAPMLSLCAAIQVTNSGISTCEMGNCASPDALDLGGSVAGTFDYIYTVAADGDRYSITGSYSASYPGSASIGFAVVANYIGNASNSTSSADTIAVDLLQNYNFVGNPNGLWSAMATLTQTGDAPGSFTEAQLSFNGVGLGLMGPYYGPGSQVFTSSANVSGLTSPLAGDFNYTFQFAAGTPAAPEPAGAGLLALGLLAFLVPAYRRRRRVMNLSSSN